MKTLKLKTFIRVHCWLLGLLLVGAAASLTAQTSPWGAAFRQRVAAMFLQAQTAATPQMAAVVAPANNTFYVRSYCGKCLAYGAPPPKREPVSPIVSTGAPAQANSSPVFIYDCNRHRTVASDILVDAIPQQVRVEEINDRHEVILHAGSKVIGVTANFLIEQAPLELQDENRSAGQGFAFDGDSIILAADGNLVAKVQGKRGKNRTPLALGRRDLDDAEFWTFTATDGSTRRPTSGFVRVPQAQEPQAQAWELWSAIHQAQPGTVIEVEASIDLTHLHNLKIPAGGTIRADRRGANPGPELRTQYDRDETMLEIAGDDVRITGLRLRGPSRSLDQHQPNITGIRAPDEYLRSIIDHNDLSDWPGAGVGVDGDRLPGGAVLPGGGHVFASRSSNNYPPHTVRVARIFIHHNQREGLGYGVVAGEGGPPSFKGNPFYLNRHAIAADGTALSGYSAFFNL